MVGVYKSQPLRLGPIDQHAPQRCATCYSAISCAYCAELDRALAPEVLLMTGENEVGKQLLRGFRLVQNSDQARR
jgi:hypothetical protein